MQFYSYTFYNYLLYLIISFVIFFILIFLYYYCYPRIIKAKQLREHKKHIEWMNSLDWDALDDITYEDYLNGLDNYIPRPAPALSTYGKDIIEKVLLLRALQGDLLLKLCQPSSKEEMKKIGLAFDETVSALDYYKGLRRFSSDELYEAYFGFPRSKNKE
jgi:hypothetical protein